MAKPPSGNHFAYKFRPDGTYVFTGLTQSALYNCTSSMFGEESGMYELNAAGSAVFSTREKLPTPPHDKLTSNSAFASKALRLTTTLHRRAG